jgi:hypothetical protein
MEKVPKNGSSDFISMRLDYGKSPIDRPSLFLSNPDSHTAEYHGKKFNCAYITPDKNESCCYRDHSNKAILIIFTPNKKAQRLRFSSAPF